MRYSDWEQRQIDIKSGEQLDRYMRKHRLAQPCKNEKERMMETKITGSVGGGTWGISPELRIVSNLSHVGRPERLQQAWRCMETGEFEWRDVPIVDDYQ